MLKQALIDATEDVKDQCDESLLRVNRLVKEVLKENPDINFENSNFDENEKKRQSLLEKQMEYSKKMSEINDMNEKCAYCLEELDNNKNNNSLKTCEILNENQTCNKEKPNEEQKQNVLVMTIK